MSLPGIRPLSAEELRHQRRDAIVALPADARLALRWLRRSHLVTSPLLPLAARRTLHVIGPGDEVARAPGCREGRIGDRYWLGARAKILPGVSVGAGTVVAAGAVVTKDCAPGARYAGMPARRLR